MKTGHGVCFLPITLKKELVSASLMQALAAFLNFPNLEKIVAVLE